MASPLLLADSAGRVHHTLLRHRFADVGSILEHAHHMKFRTLGGIGSFHILFQIFFSSLVVECSTFSYCLSQSAIL